MAERARAEEHLRIIRTLMERATVYRAISSPTALVGGLLALGLSTALYYAAGSLTWISYTSSRKFALVWLALLAVMLAVNALFVWREANRAGRPFFSSGMRLAIRAFAPCLLVPAATTIWFLRQGYLGNSELLLVTCWIAFYGLALLSTSLFAPQSLTILGWAFLLSALFVPTSVDLLDDLPSHLLPNLFMGLTFGVYHLVYAACTWRRRALPTPAATTAFE
jgi:hypothetical protein